MRWIKEHIPALAAAILFVAMLFVAFPFYQYYIDPDATAYLTIAKRYAAGDFEKAINGYWSPWSIWLTAILMKTGIASFKAAITVNAIGAIGFLFISHSFFLLFKLRKDIQWFLNGALIVFLIYAVFWQSFDDLWECFFLLLVLRIMFSENFSKKFSLWVGAGFIGALAYFAKAYAFPFFIFEIIVCTYFITNARLKVNRSQWLKIVFVSILSMHVFSFPWMYFLHEKYGVWMTGTAGNLNTSWYLVGHPYWKEDLLHLLPPVYADSPSYWEDPFYANGIMPHFWDSPQLFLLQIVRVGFNLLKFVQSINELSYLFAVAIIAALVVLFSKRIRANTDYKFVTLCISFLLFPMAYFLVNFQGRYLWYMLPLSMIILAVALQHASLFHQINKRLRFIVIAIFAFSFVAFPVVGLKEMYKVGLKEYEMAQALKHEKITGSFTTNIPYGKQTQNIVRLSYFSGNPYYNMPLPTSKASLLKEMRRYKVNYYFHFYEGDWDEFQFEDEGGRAFVEVAQGKVPGIKVFLVH